MNLSHTLLTALADDQERLGNEAMQRGDAARAAAHFEALDRLCDAMVALGRVEGMEMAGMDAVTIAAGAR